MSKCVLVVDDDSEMRLLLQTLLEEEAYEVENANNGLAALDKIIQHKNAHQPYEAILLDLIMPCMNGLQLIQVLRHFDAAWLRSVIVLSGDQSAIQQAHRLGVCQSLTKPFNLETLLELISSRVHYVS